MADARAVALVEQVVEKATMCIDKGPKHQGCAQDLKDALDKANGLQLQENQQMVMQACLELLFELFEYPLSGDKER